MADTIRKSFMCYFCKRSLGRRVARHCDSPTCDICANCRARRRA